MKSHDIIRKPRMEARTLEEFRIMMITAINELNKGNADKLLHLDFGELDFRHDNLTEHVSTWRVKPVEHQYIPKFLGWNGNITLVFSSRKFTGKNRRKLEAIVESIEGVNFGSGGVKGNSYSSAQTNGKIIEGYVRMLSVTFFMVDFPLVEKQCNVDLTMENIGIT